MTKISRIPSFNPALTPSMPVTGRGISGDGSIADLRSDAVMHLVPGVEDSYDGVSGTLKNLVTSPADGSAQSDYDFNDGGMPLVGTVGVAGSYLTVDAKYMTIVTPSPDWISKIGRSNTTGWIAFGISTTDTAGGASLFSNQNADTKGMYIKKQGNETTLGQTINAGGSINATAATPYFPLATDVLVLMSWDGSNLHVWHAGDGTVQVEAFVIPTDTTLVATTTCNLFATATGGTLFSTGTDTRLYSVMAGTGLISTDEDYAAIVAVAEAKDNKTYLPVLAALMFNVAANAMYLPLIMA